MEEKLSETSNILRRLRDKRIGKNILTSTPQVTVVIPAYNISPFAAEALDSVFQQTFKDFEVVIVNDGSEDTLLLEENLEPYFDNIIYARQDNSGAAAARNLAICFSRGNLIAFLDGDDIWLPNYLDSQFKFLNGNNLDMVYCDAKFFGENYFDGKTYMETTPSTGNVDSVSLITGECNVITSGTVIKRTTLTEFGLFDLRLKRAQDFDLWFRLAKNGVKIGYQRSVLIKYRVSPTSLTGSNIQRAEREVLGLSFIRDKYQLNDTENDVLVERLLICEAQVDIEKGKFYLIQGDYEKAANHISRANEYYRKPKLTFIIWLMKFSPSLTLKLFKKLRRSEFAFITAKSSLE